MAYKSVQRKVDVARADNATFDLFLCAETIRSALLAQHAAEKNSVAGDVRDAVKWAKDRIFEVEQSIENMKFLMPELIFALKLQKQHLEKLIRAAQQGGEK